MPTADYKCDECGRVFEHNAKDLPATLTLTHDFHPNMRKLCSNKELTRVWSKFGVGRGTSGGTPPR